ncbi:unnamed protein product [Owenia fusiformis]|uniref:Uncharacterized protein n=1 Tax=Owenia fusiformis TaxID=6347 RepID=A0A8J1XW47_OWEFU|nr:unnamed protein product [Owenia fusiformis]
MLVNGHWCKVIRNHPNNTTTIEWRVLYKSQYREYKQGRGVEMEKINTNLILKHSFELTPNNSLPKKIKIGHNYTVELMDRTDEPGLTDEQGLTDEPALIVNSVTDNVVPEVTDLTNKPKPTTEQQTDGLVPEQGSEQLMDQMDAH